ncbi:hypothetical protein [Gilliamella sp. Bif1-4]|uniref:hypothetical protein n=1 Tax=Gilliamella sp. Bif1-4 TaxID=3120233 RepID=UPI0009BE2756|nr:hypothetical protein [Gilliamella apicola]
MIKIYISYLIFCVFPFFAYAQEPLIKNNINKSIPRNNKNLCFEKSTDILPLNKIYKNVKYNLANNENCKIEDLESWNCEIDFRYIPIPSKNDINVILVPQDCGDFPYRLYLLTIKDNQIRSDLYVEGEWYEPGNNEDLVEKTHFTISTDFIITVTTEYDNNLTIKHYDLDQNGYIREKTNDN